MTPLEPTPPEQTDQATEQWFDSLQTPTPQPSLQKNRRLKHLFIGCGVLGFLAIAGTITALVVNQGPACLGADDYTSLTGETTGDILAPTDSFYTNYVLFANGTYDNLTDSGEHGQQLIQKIANFYTAAKNKSVIVTVSANYFTADAKNEAEQHIGVIKSSLLNAGIPESIINIKSASYIEPEDSTASKSEVIITVNSATSCK